MKESEADPSVLEVKYEELQGHDTVEVDLMPERKGIFLKHVEYEVNSKVISVLFFCHLFWKPL